MNWQCALCHTADFPRSKKKRALCEVCYDGLVARGLAWCARGGHRVPIAALGTGKHQSNCRACNNRTNRERYLPGSNIEHAKAWRAANPDKVRAYNRGEKHKRAAQRYELRHRSRRNAQKARWRQTRRAKDAEIMKQWRAANPERAREHSRNARIRKKLRILRSFRAA
jgi:hypothetical protein